MDRDTSYMRYLQYVKKYALKHYVFIIREIYFECILQVTLCLSDHSRSPQIHSCLSQRRMITTSRYMTCTIHLTDVDTSCQSETTKRLETCK